MVSKTIIANEMSSRLWEFLILLYRTSYSRGANASCRENFEAL